MTDRCNISNYFLRDTNSKLAIPLPQTNVSFGFVTKTKGLSLVLYSMGKDILEDTMGV